MPGRTRTGALRATAAALVIALTATSCSSTPQLRSGRAETGASGSATTTSAPGGTPIRVPDTAPRGPTNRGDNGRDGWYPDEPGLSPATVRSAHFGELFSTKVNGQVLAQPLIDHGVLVVATETDWVYGLDPATGAIRWSRRIGNAYRESPSGCRYLYPDIGVTSTPTVDAATGIVYLVDQAYVSGGGGPIGWYMQAIDPATGAEEPHFPVQIGGTAGNNPNAPFIPTQQLQRPGLLLLGGVVYAAFASHCDNEPYFGFIAGVSTSGHETTLWSTEGSNPGSEGGIWQSGAGLASDGPNQILFVSGNGAIGTSPSGKIAGSAPPMDLGESVARLEVEPDGALEAVAFFTPYDAILMDQTDIELGSGGLVVLPSDLSTRRYPDLLVTAGKEGYLYLLDGDDLGGVGNGSGRGDAYLARLGPSGGVYSTAAVWPGNGGYLYLPTVGAGPLGEGALDAYALSTAPGGAPTLKLAGSASEGFAKASSSAVVTSDGTTSGSALVWIVNITGDGELQAYTPVPVGGRLRLLRSWPLAGLTHFSEPAVGTDRVYVATTNGQVIGFGSTLSPALTSAGASFPDTIAGQTSHATVTLTAQRAVTVSAVGTDSSVFSTGTASRSFPATLAAGDKLSVPVTFAPTGNSAQQLQALTVSTSSGLLEFALSGQGLSRGPDLVPETSGLSLGGAALGTTLTSTLAFTNYGATAATITKVQALEAPFKVENLPPVGTRIEPGHSFTVTIEFRPAKAGYFQATFLVDSTGGNSALYVTAEAAPART